jgi:hypothetical protein
MKRQRVGIDCRALEDCRREKECNRSYSIRLFPNKGSIRWQCLIARARAYGIEMLLFPNEVTTFACTASMRHIACATNAHCPIRSWPRQRDEPGQAQSSSFPAALSRVPPLASERLQSISPGGGKLQLARGELSLSARHAVEINPFSHVIRCNDMSETNLDFDAQNVQARRVYPL